MTRMKKSLRRRYLQAKANLARLRKKYANHPDIHRCYSNAWLILRYAVETEQKLAADLGRSLGHERDND